MNQREILLKIKRRLSNREEIKLLLQRISELEMEVGILKSELQEERDKNHIKIALPKTSHGKTQKEWLKDDLFSVMQKELGTTKGRLKTKTVIFKS